MDLKIKICQERGSRNPLVNPPGTRESLSGIHQWMGKFLSGTLLELGKYLSGAPPGIGKSLGGTLLELGNTLVEPRQWKPAGDREIPQWNALGTAEMGDT